jgi:hypothetical protein
LISYFFICKLFLSFIIFLLSLLLDNVIYAFLFGFYSYLCLFRCYNKNYFDLFCKLGDYDNEYYVYVIKRELSWFLNDFYNVLNKLCGFIGNIEFERGYEGWVYVGYLIYYVFIGDI